MKPVLTLTLNPAIDMTMVTEQLAPRRKLRCGPVRYDPGGGGVNVARQIVRFGGRSTAIVATGGPTGELLCERLSEANVETVCLPADGITRHSVQVFVSAEGAQYRFVPAGPTQTLGTLRAVIDGLRDYLAADTYEYLVASGSLPPGAPDTLYADVARLAREAGVRFVLDASGAPLERALDARLFLLAPNRAETLQLAGDPEGSPQAVGAAIIDGGNAEVVITTLGAEGALLTTREMQGSFRVPPVDVVSTAGAGDSFLAGLVHGLASGWPVAEACRYGVAAATAAVTTEATALAEADDVERLLPQVEWQDLPSGGAGPGG